MIFEQFEKGLAAGAWVVGLALALGILALLMYALCLTLKYAFGGGEEERQEAVRQEATGKRQ